jgi:hypothetical protein
VIGPHGHPEARDGEVLTGNMWRSDFAKVGWKTKRRGKIAYLTDGRPIPKSQVFVPCFVQRSEIEAAGVDIPEDGVIDHRW